MNNKQLAAILLSLALAIALPAQCFAQTQASPDESQLTEHGHYTNKNGQSVHSPAHSTNGKFQLAPPQNVEMVPTVLAGIVRAPAPGIMGWQSGSDKAVAATPWR